MKKKSLASNLLYQSLYQILITITPIITSPYLSRVLGSRNLGIYSFTYSIVNYFALFAMLGVTTYGTKIIAATKIEDRKRNASQIYTMQIISCSISLILFIICGLFINENRYIVFSQIFWIISCFFNVDWYYFGCEDFKSTVTRNSIIKLLTVCSILIFVKNEESLLIYVLIMAVGNMLSQFVTFIKLFKRKYISIVNITEIRNHIAPNLKLFIPLLAMSIFHITDKLMLGFFSTFEESGFYYNADKLINIPLGLLIGFGTVMLSRCSSLIKEKKFDEHRNLVIISFDLFIMISSALAFGIAGVSKEFIPLFFGNGYDNCIILTILLSSVMIIKSIFNILTNQIYIPFNKNRIYISSVICGAISNIVFNFIFIALLDMGALGAVIGTILAEFITTSYQIIRLKSVINLYKELFRSMIYILFGLVMFILIFNLDKIIIINSFAMLILKMTIGCVIYLFFCFIYWCATDNKNYLYIKKYIKDKFFKNMKK